MNDFAPSPSDSASGAAADLAAVFLLDAAGRVTAVSDAARALWQVEAGGLLGEGFPDLFVCEAAFRDGVENPPGVHITGVHAGEYATKAHVKKLVVTHVPPWHDPADALREARSAYDGPTELAATGAVYEI